LTSAFTANINAELKVGSVQETITVSGATPTVDIQNVVQQKTFAREVLDVLPIGAKGWNAVAILVPGVKLTGAQNVGGTGSSNATAAVHGGNGAEAIMLLDGMRYNQGNGVGGVRNAYNENDGSVEEITFQTAALSAETETGSFVRNIVPKEGGNSFKAFFGAAYTNHSLQADNLDDALRARGVPSVNFVDVIYDYNPAVGGPIKDKLWFCSAFRAWGVTRASPPPTSTPPQGERLHTGPVAPCAEHVHQGQPEHAPDMARDPRNKVAFYYEYQQNWEQWSYGQGALGSGNTGRKAGPLRGRAQLVGAVALEQPDDVAPVAGGRRHPRQYGLPDGSAGGQRPDPPSHHGALDRYVVAEPRLGRT
jgi:hypothetical protein